jgi:hypothetical protein
MQIAPRTLKRIGLGFLGGWLLFLLLGWLALPRILQSQAQRYVSAKAGQHLTLAQPEFNPFTFALTVRDLKLTEPDGKPLLAFDALTVDVSVASLLRRALVFDRIALDHPQATLALQRDGRLNWSALLDALEDKQAPAEKSALPRLLIHDLAITRGGLAFSDARAGYANRVEPLELHLTELSTLPDDAGGYQFSARDEGGATLRWQGQLELNPLAVSGSVALENVQLQRLAPYLDPLLPGPPPAGTARLSGDYRFAYAQGKAGLTLDKVAARIDGLRLALTSRPGPRFAADSIAADGGSYDLLRQQAAVAGLRLQGARLEWPQGSRPTSVPLTLADLQVQAIGVDLAARRATVERVALKGGRVQAVRSAQGRIDLLDLPAAFATPAAGTPPARPVPARVAAVPRKPAPATPAWGYRIGHIELAGVGAALRDETLSPAASLAVEDIALRVEGVSERLDQPLPVKASLRFPAGGRFTASGSVTPGAPAADLALALEALSLKPAQPWLASTARLVLERGQVSAAGQLVQGARGVSYRGSFSVDDLKLIEKDSGNLFMAWKRFGSRDVDAAQDHLNLGKLTLDGLDTRLIIGKDKSVNVVSMFHAPASNGAVPNANATTITPATSMPATATPTVAPPAAVAPAAPAPASAAPSFVVNIDRLRLKSCELDFADYSLALPFGTHIHHLRGSINGLSTRPGAPGQVELDGQVDEYGLARAVGQIDLFKPTDFMDLKVDFRNVDMARLTPYSATFAGRRIDGGRLSLKLEYRIKQRQLAGDNRITIDHIRLGEKVAHPEAKDLPLELAIALLEDSDGRIDLGLPVSGSLDDPDFSYGGIVWKAILNIFGKIATAPFRLLGNLFGGDGGFEEIVFEPGMARLSPPEREKLVHLAAMLNKRPGLAVTVRGPWSPSDRVALQDRQVRRAVALRSGQKLDEREDPGPLSTATPRIREALEALFTERFGAAELLALQAGYRQANPGQLPENVAGRMLSRLNTLIRQPRTLDAGEVTRMQGADFHALLFDRLRMNEPVTDAQLLALARARTQEVMGSMTTAGAPVGGYAPGEPAQVKVESGDVALMLEPGSAPKPPSVVPAAPVVPVAPVAPAAAN